MVTFLPKAEKLFFLAGGTLFWNSTDTLSYLTKELQAKYKTCFGLLEWFCIVSEKNTAASPLLAVGCTFFCLYFLTSIIKHSSKIECFCFFCNYSDWTSKMLVEFVRCLYNRCRWQEEWGVWTRQEQKINLGAAGWYPIVPAHNIELVSEIPPHLY